MSPLLDAVTWEELNTLVEVFTALAEMNTRLTQQVRVVEDELRVLKSAFTRMVART